MEMKKFFDFNPRISSLLKISVLIIFVLTANSFGNSAQRINGTEITDREYVLELLPGNDNPRNSEGDFVRLKDGRILFIYSHFTGQSTSDHAHAFLAGRYSYDNGKTWTKKDVKIIEQEGEMNVMSVSLLRLQNGEIALFYLIKNSETDCMPVLRISNDEAKTWSDPIPCITDSKGYFVLNNNRVIQLKNGRLLLAVAKHHGPGESGFSQIGRIWSYFSDDNGRSWKSGLEIPNPDAIVTQEPGVVELKNGDILMFMRTKSGVQYFSYSKDKGETWSSVEPGNIKSPCSPASITRIPSTGDLMLVWNDKDLNPFFKDGKNTWINERTPLNIAISKDEGKTWINEKTLEDNPEGSFCYPAVIYLDNEILLSYFNWTTVGSTIIRFDVNWLYYK